MTHDEYNHQRSFIQRSPGNSLAHTQLYICNRSDENLDQSLSANALQQTDTKNVSDHLNYETQSNQLSNQVHQIEDSQA